ncbi:multidrug resistance efflux pump [Citrobacter sp. 506]
MMTPEQKFARWVRVSIAAFLVIFAWFIVADIWSPLTPDSTVMRVVTPVSSRVSGYVALVATLTMYFWYTGCFQIACCFPVI